jgi:hypothetical protein
LKDQKIQINTESRNVKVVENKEGGLKMQGNQPVSGSPNQNFIETAVRKCLVILETRFCTKYDAVS